MKMSVLLFPMTLVNFANNDIFIDLNIRGPLSIYCSPTFVFFCITSIYSIYITLGIESCINLQCLMHLIYILSISEAVSLSCRAGDFSVADYHSGFLPLSESSYIGKSLVLWIDTFLYFQPITHLPSCGQRKEPQ